MTMFPKTKTKPENRASRSKGFSLPEGHDDFDSPTYVPEHLRSLWPEHADTPLARQRALLNKTVDRLGEHALELLAKADEPQKTRMEGTYEDGQLIGGRRVPVPRPPKRLGAVAARQALAGGHSLYGMGATCQDELPFYVQEHEDELTLEAAHCIRLMAVEGVYVAEQAEQKRAREEYHRYLCPRCGQSDPEAGEPAHREVVPVSKNGRGKSLTFAGCLRCYLAFTHELTKAATEAVLTINGQTRTRGEVIGDYLRGQTLTK
jgi:hypothetical protein